MDDTRFIGSTIKRGNPTDMGKSYTILSSKTFPRTICLKLNEDTDVSSLAQSGVNGGELKVNVYLAMTVTLSSASKYPTDFEYCARNNEDGFIVTLKTITGSWEVRPVSHGDANVALDTRILSVSRIAG